MWRKKGICTVPLHANAMKEKL